MDAKEPEKKTETRNLLSRYKQESNVSTRTRRAAYKEAENRTLYRLMNRIPFHTNVKRFGILLGSIAAWASLLLAEEKDIITIAGIFYFDQEVIFGRYVLVEGVQLHHILIFHLFLPYHNHHCSHNPSHLGFLHQCWQP